MYRPTRQLSFRLRPQARRLQWTPRSPRLLAVLVATFSAWGLGAEALTISITDPNVTHSTVSGGFTVSLQPDTHAALGAGATGALRGLIPAQTSGAVEVVAGGTIAGTLSISVLDAAAGGGLGGLDIVAVATGLPALGAGHQYRWVQFIDTSHPLGGTTNPYVDPRPNDDPVGASLPFYWTNAERGTAGVGTTAGGDILFSDSPRRVLEHGTTWLGNLYLADYEATGGTGGSKKITIFDGVQYGFKIVPEPGTGLLTAVGLILFAVPRRGRAR